MKKIKRFGAIPRLHIEECFGYHILVRQFLGMLTTEDMAAMILRYQKAIAELDLALKETRKSTYTKKIHEADDRVNTTWRSMRLYVKSMIEFPNEETQVVAQEAYDLFEKYGDITHMSYEEHYGNLENLYEDLLAMGTEKQTLLGLTPWMTELDKRKDEYTAARVGRVQEKSEHVKGLALQCRIDADDTYEELVERVNALSLINGDADYASFISSINVLIDEQMSKLSARQTRAEHRKEKEGEGGEEPTDPPIDPDLPAE